jgi:predicted nucleic acid-binding protein
MSGGKAFVDSNVFLYAHDPGQGAKHERAKALLEELWVTQRGVISTQVLQEVYVNLRRKLARPLARREAAQLVEDYLSWEVVTNDGGSMLLALELEERYEISFWDALIVAAANVAKVDVLYSEDLNDGQRYGSVTVRNPFAT